MRLTNRGVRNRSHLGYLIQCSGWNSLGILQEVSQQFHHYEDKIITFKVFVIFGDSGGHNIIQTNVRSPFA